MIPTRRWILPALTLLACTGCGGSAGGDAEAAAATTTAAELAGEAGFPLPGEEALTPPPPDAAADEHRESLAALPDGALVADLELSVSGLTAFSEPISGSCASMASAPTMTATLSDGSSLHVGFAEEGGTLLLAAAGIESAHTLAGVDLDATSGGFRLAADLLTAGTSEPSGSVVLDGTCR